MGDADARTRNVSSCRHSARKSVVARRSVGATLTATDRSESYSSRDGVLRRRVTTAARKRSPARTYPSASWSDVGSTPGKARLGGPGNVASSRFGSMSGYGFVQITIGTTPASESSGQRQSGENGCCLVRHPPFALMPGAARFARSLRRRHDSARGERCRSPHARLYRALRRRLRRDQESARSPWPTRAPPGCAADTAANEQRDNEVFPAAARTRRQRQAWTGTAASWPAPVPGPTRDRCRNARPALPRDFCQANADQTRIHAFR